MRELFSTTQTIDTYVYRGLMEQGNVGMSSAAGVYQSLVGFALVMIAKLYCAEKKIRKTHCSRRQDMKKDSQR